MHLRAKRRPAPIPPSAAGSARRAGPGQCARPGRRAALLAAWALLLAPQPGRAEPPPLGIESVRVASGLAAPVLAAAPAGDPRLFVVEQAGRIQILAGGALLPAPFLDIRSKVDTAGGNAGLLGLAFPHDYAATGHFYVYYTKSSPDEIVLARYRVGADPDIADTTEQVLLSISNPGLGHSGGSIAFGPAPPLGDGLLYLAPGDGGFGIYDPPENAQNGLERLGKVLRFDASGAFTDPLSIPASNPFVGNASVLDEIWALGLRNPFRFGFDRATGDLWISDVGQEDREEINRQPAGDPGGRNYGWDVMEGTLCNPFDPAPAPPCNDPSLTPPVHEYAHADGNCSVTGGTVYRGASIPALLGLYVFSDFCSSRIWTLDPSDLTVTERTAELSPSAGGHTLDQIVAFGEDGAGELYAVDLDGELFGIRANTALPSLGGAQLALLGVALLAAACLVLRRQPRAQVDP